MENKDTMVAVLSITAEDTDSDCDQYDDYAELDTEFTYDYY